jgi:zinc D-Ala-D-Ala carboxypeptidase
MQISDHLTLEQATRSQTASRLGINNTPSPLEIEEIKKTALELFDPIKNKFGDLMLTSLYRCDKLNKAIGGSKTSQHRLGQAIDIDRPTLEKNKELFEWIKDNLVFGQLIWEFGNHSGPDWVHVGRGTKKQLLIAYSIKGKTAYKPYT